MAPVRAGLNRIPPVAGAILAGGESKRFGSDKALAPTPAGPLAGVALAALRGAGLDPVVLIGGSSELSAQLGVPMVPDRLPGQGPLAGLGTALSWAAGVARIVVVPCDMPLVDAAVIRALVQTGDNFTASIACVDGVPHPILGCWPTHAAASINTMLRSGQRRMDDALDANPYVLVDVAAASVQDADDPAELERLVGPGADGDATPLQ